jgi:hypothetical protein
MSPSDEPFALASLFPPSCVMLVATFSPAATHVLVKTMACVGPGAMA